MDHVESLNRLEAIVNNLLGSLDAVAGEKRKLGEQLQLLGEENRELKQELARLREEKDQVRHRVGGLIETIEKWERNFASPQPDVTGETGQD
ncbi:MAG TPA: cell division protein ZapB [Desulfurivibrio alkaliphilus]|uniref:Cell division protein ZapB n=1 Tax=Desulfurivibrio alkaliphilus TaxID=427923 RepID=A0A7C2X9Z5_9BACT|nr:cell division protein ZapB [Desulfurivibrio alkaliphilus]